MERNKQNKLHVCLIAKLREYKIYIYVLKRFKLKKEMKEDILA
jgi:hypothetical protein